MKKLALALTLALAFLPAVAPAQQPPPVGHATPSPAMRSLMKQAWTLHEQFRSHVLSALTPAHRTMVANALGQLAVSTNPDPKAVVSHIDAALSSSEKQQIMSAQASFRSRMKALRQQMMAQMPHRPAPMKRPMSGHPWGKPTAGMVLVHALVMGGMGPHGMMGGPRGAPPQP